MLTSEATGTLPRRAHAADTLDPIVPQQLLASAQLRVLRPGDVTAFLRSAALRTKGAPSKQWHVVRALCSHHCHPAPIDVALHEDGLLHAGMAIEESMGAPVSGVDQQLGAMRMLGKAIDHLLTVRSSLLAVHTLVIDSDGALRTEGEPLTAPALPVTTNTLPQQVRPTPGDVSVLCPYVG